MLADELIIFFEALVIQAEICDASGHRVNQDKSNIYFSRNVVGQIRHDIGRYLGSNTQAARISKHHFSHKFKLWLFRWQVELNSLSRSMALWHPIRCSIFKCQEVCAVTSLGGARS
ncbi:hypothetical protein AAHE18_11G109900 [Arachis hypogaea]